MAGLKTTEIISSLRAIRETTRSCRRRFLGHPLFALGVSAEGPDPKWSDGHIRVEEAAWYLQIQQEQVTAVGKPEFRNVGDLEPWCPYFAYLKPGSVKEANVVSRLISKQLTAMNIVCASLEELIAGFPKRLQESYCFPHNTCWEMSSPCWWQVLFHLATHYPTAELSVVRSRWVNIYGSVHYKRGSRSLLTRPRYRHTDKLDEYHRQLDEANAPSKDIWPGTIWCELKQDIFGATKRAIEVLIDLVKVAEWGRQEPKPQPFRSLLAEFDELAEPVVKVPVASARVSRVDEGPAVDETDEIATPLMSAAAGDDYELAKQSCTQPLIIRVGSPFTTPSARGWCDPLSSIDEKFIPLARWNGFIEFVTYRNMHPDFEAICERAGDALPEWKGVVPLMSYAKVADSECRDGADCAVAVSDPVAKWIRFVFDTLRRNCPKEVLVNFPIADRRAVAPWAPYGYMKLQQGFFRSSAMAIRARFPIYDPVRKRPRKVSQPRAPKELPAGVDPYDTPELKRALAIKKFAKTKPGKAYAYHLQALKALELEGQEKITDQNTLDWVQENRPGYEEMEIGTWRTYITRGRKIHGVLKKPRLADERYPADRRKGRRPQSADDVGS